MAGKAHLGSQSVNNPLHQDEAFGREGGWNKLELGRRFCCIKGIPQSTLGRGRGQDGSEVHETLMDGLSCFPFPNLHLPLLSDNEV